MILSMVIVFAVGYLLIACESVVRVSKTVTALLLGGALWSLYAVLSGETHFHAHLMFHLGETCEILVFLMGAMTIVEHIDRYGGFSFLVSGIHTRSKRKLMWILAFVTFFMSAVLDNMTTTIIMVVLIGKLFDDPKERWLFAGIIVIAANSGGAWSPIGDVTTIMIWMSDKVTSGKLVVNLLVPCLVSLIVPLLLVMPMVKGHFTPSNRHMGDDDDSYKIGDAYPRFSRLMLFTGVLALLFVPVFKTITGLPPFIGMMIALGVVWLETELLLHRYHVQLRYEADVASSMRRIDMSSIVFFLGILLAVAALQEAHVLSGLAHELNGSISNPFVMTSLIGVISSIIDNVPLVSACIKMFSDASFVSSSSIYLQDGLFWHLLTYASGVGGSLLVIGSAAGVVAMGLEKISFFWYVKRITLLAFSGYIAGILVIWLEHSVLSFF